MCDINYIYFHVYSGKRCHFKQRLSNHICPILISQHIDNCVIVIRDFWFWENVKKFLHDQIVVILGQKTTGWEPLHHIYAYATNHSIVLFLPQYNKTCDFSRNYSTLIQNCFKMMHFGCFDKNIHSHKEAGNALQRTEAMSPKSVFRDSTVDDISNSDHY